MTNRLSRGSMKLLGNGGMEGGMVDAGVHMMAGFAGRV